MRPSANESREPETSDAPMRGPGVLSITNLQVYYDHAVEAVRDVSLEVGAGRIVALLGSNGAGKSTVLKAISGVLYPEEGEITGGQIRFDGARLERCPPHEIVRRGLVQVPEGRRLFDTLTVEENLRMGGYVRPATDEAADSDKDAGEQCKQERTLDEVHGGL